MLVVYIESCNLIGQFKYTLESNIKLPYLILEYFAGEKLLRMIQISRKLTLCDLTIARIVCIY